jgi:hypothetical protein
VGGLGLLEAPGFGEWRGWERKCILPLNVLKGRLGFKIAHLKVRSLTSKTTQLRLDLPGSGRDVFTLSETWFHQNTEPQLTSIPS